jgi:RIO kinase 1
MKIPKELQSLIEDGVIDEVIRPLKSGKEAAVYVVRAKGEPCCAKVYKDMSQRSFKKRAQYQEGRRVRNSRQARAIRKRSRFGRREEESEWKNAEVDALYQLMAAGVRVPKPYGYFDGVLLMELVVDAEGNPAPSLSNIEFTPEDAHQCHRVLIQQVQRMLCTGLIHGDLSPYNVLVGRDGPVIIDLPQAVNAAGNNNAQAMLLRDVDNLTDMLERFAPDLRQTRYGQELWRLFKLGDLRTETVLTGEFVGDDSVVDIEGVQQVIEDARDENERRQRGREEADGLQQKPTRLNVRG